MSKYKTVQEAVAAAYEALEEAERIAMETGESFGFCPEYGMGGYFQPEYQNEYTSTHWHPSSIGC